MKLRILTINVQNDEGDPRRLGLINSELRRLDPDIVAFQEVLRTGERDQLDELLDGPDRQGTHQAQAMAYAPPGQIATAAVLWRPGGLIESSRSSTSDCSTRPMSPGARWPS